MKPETERSHNSTAAAPPPIVVVVLGAGRSGTSATTRALSALGVELGDKLRPGRGKNPTGFFEDRDLLALNQRLKRALGIRGDSVGLIEPDAWQQPAVRDLHRRAVDTIRRRFGAYPLWGYKYGRTLRLLPFWLEVYAELRLDTRYLVALRNPLSVARSRQQLDPHRGTQEKSDLEWLVNVVPYFRLIRARPFVVADYDVLMGDAVQQLERIAAGLHLPTTAQSRDAIRTYAEEFLKPEMRHTRFTPADLDRDPAVHPLVRDAYRWLYRMAVGEVDTQSPQFWDDWQRIEAGVAALAPILRHLDRLEAELRRAQRNPIGPLQVAPQLWRKLRQR